MHQRIQAALESRKTIRKSDTDAFRLIDGRGDGFDDLEIDDFAGHWLVQTMHGAKLDAPFVIRENGVKFWIDFNAGYSQGIFLDQRDNRLALRQIAMGKTVLNTFAYTCAFGVCAALGGAATVNVDLSKRYLDWGKRNYELNGLDPGMHEFIYGDAASWMKRFQKKQRCFDVIVLDPPTFSRNEKGGVFTIESGFGELVRAAVQILAPRGCILCSTNQRTIGASEFRALIEAGLDDLRAWKFRAAPMPPDFRGEHYLKTWWYAAVALEM
jgi:23S rRNA (cytosine1962-C5)-methyltransferase